ncbi:MAG: YolD-like family protein [Staphylococcus equorum]|nr:YolD-like family protein [Staphylococcus equorum]
MKVINPNAPDEYKYETDYRKIPREYLNPNIPQGRHMVKWQAFKTMPEQYERIEQYMLDQNKIERPILSDDQINNLNQKLIDKMFNNPYVELKYFEEGYIKEISGYVHKVDVHNSELQLSVRGEINKFSLLDIVEIK